MRVTKVLCGCLVVLWLVSWNGNAVQAQTYTWPENGHTYVVLSTCTYSSCSTDAQTLGGHLVTVNDSSEQDMLQSTFTSVSEFWIGYHDTGSEGSFAWTSGESPGYTNWNGGEPNNGGGQFTNEDCTILARHIGGYWNDYECSHGRYAVAEIVCDDSEPLYLEDNIEIGTSVNHDRNLAIVVSNGTADYYRVGASGDLVLTSETSIQFRGGFSVAPGGTLSATIVADSSCD